MPAIQMNYHGGKVTLDPLVVGGHKPLCDNGVPVLLKDGATERITLGGFVSSVEQGQQMVKVADIRGYTLGDAILGQWAYLPNDVLLLGVYSNHQVFLQLPPVIVGRYQPPPPFKAPVVPIFG